MDSSPQTMDRAMEQARSLIEAREPWQSMLWTQTPGGVKSTPDLLRMELMVDGQGQAALALTREQDGRIRTEPEIIGTASHPQGLHIDAQRLQSDVVRSLAREALDTVTDRRHPQDELDALHQSLIPKVKEILEQNMAPGECRYHTLDDAAKGFINIAKNRLADRDTIAETTRFNGGKWNLNVYNTLRSNREVLGQAHETARSVETWFKDRAVNDPTREWHTGSVPEMVQDARASTGLKGAPWRVFLELEGLRPSFRGHPEDTTFLCRLIAKANRPGADPQRILTAMAMSPARQTLAGNEDAFDAWTRVVNRFLALPGETQGDEKQDLAQISDAITLLGEIGEPFQWSQNNWEGHVARARRVDSDVYEGRLGPGSDQEWPVALRELPGRRFRFRAATTPREMAFWAKEMHNCLASYTGGCRAGNDRVFIATDPDDRPIAALQLRLEGGRWQCVQTQGSQCEETPPEVERATPALVQAYQAAWERQNREEETGTTRPEDQIKLDLGQGRGEISCP